MLSPSVHCFYRRFIRPRAEARGLELYPFEQLYAAAPEFEDCHYYIDVHFIIVRIPTTPCSRRIPAPQIAMPQI
eukprot:779830-Pyramimonas_sp.AAC.1